MVFDLQLPALAWLLGHGQRTLLPMADSGRWLAGLLKLPEQSMLPAAALRTHAQGLAQTGRWLCLDPIHLRVERTQLIVEDPLALQLELAESQALAADLAPLLAELGELHIGSAHEWHLHLHEVSDIRTTPLPDAIGLIGDTLMPQAANVRVWRRLLNEVQMLLHTHPVNSARTARGLPAVNSLWPWGEGSLPATGSQSSGQVWSQIRAPGALWQGLAQHLGAAYDSTPQRHTAHRGRTFVLNESLAAATQARDAVRWRAALMQLEADWFAPLQAALCQGELDRLVLHGYGSGHALQVVVKPRDRFCFWRKPAALTVLGVNN